MRQFPDASRPKYFDQPEQEDVTHGAHYGPDQTEATR